MADTDTHFTTLRSRPPRRNGAHTTPSRRILHLPRPRHGGNYPYFPGLNPQGAAPLQSRPTHQNDAPITPSQRILDLPLPLHVGNYPYFPGLNPLGAAPFQSRPTYQNDDPIPPTHRSGADPVAPARPACETTSPRFHGRSCPPHRPSPPSRSRWPPRRSFS